MAGLAAITVHGNAHRATGLAPFGTGEAENFIQPLGFCLVPDADLAGHDQHAKSRRDLAAAHDAGGDAQIADARIGA